MYRRVAKVFHLLRLLDVDGGDPLFGLLNDRLREGTRHHNIAIAEVQVNQGLHILLAYQVHLS